MKTDTRREERQEREYLKAPRSLPFCTPCTLMIYRDRRQASSSRCLQTIPPCTCAVKQNVTSALTSRRPLRSWLDGSKSEGSSDFLCQGDLLEIFHKANHAPSTPPCVVQPRKVRLNRKPANSIAEPIMFLRGTFIGGFNLTLPTRTGARVCAEAHRLLVEAYNEAASSERPCREWFQKFKNGDFHVEDKDRSGRLKNCEDAELEELMEEHSSRTQKELALTLEVTRQAVSHRLKSFGIIHKQDIALSGYHLFRSIAHTLSEQQFTSYEDTKNWIDSWIASKDKELLKLGIGKQP
ncbi:Mariner Mos1 transposase [Eumeta japonica]|uniref:Mariner Mos1 transposase n=1 Tax=Eumeta variegata TaxID=151549 RepID=A0A4C1W8Z2_EUMVA|nr:Mariner Mos1 transposase [Eumeta japonica]